MSFYRDGLPQLADGIFLTDGGLETDLVFHQGIDLPHAAAYILLEDEAGVARLARYFAEYLAIAQELGVHYRALLERFPHISVLGGCCGTDARHIRQIAEACVPH